MTSDGYQPDTSWWSWSAATGTSGTECRCRACNTPVRRNPWWPRARRWRGRSLGDGFGALHPRRRWMLHDSIPARIPGVAERLAEMAERERTRSAMRPSPPALPPAERARWLLGPTRRL